MQKLFAVIFIFALAGSCASTTWAQRNSSRFGSDSRQSSYGSQLPNRSLELRVMVDDRSAVGARHEWMQALAEVGADRVVAESSRVSEPSFKEFDNGSTKLLTVVGIVRKGKLHLPGGKFSIRQTSAIRSHLKKLRDDGAEVTVAEKVGFGLTAKQLLSVHDKLGVKVGTSTKGKNAGELATSLLKKSGYSTSIDASTRRTLTSAESKIDYELESFSKGTSLALILRQMGLAFEPNRPQGQNIKLLVRRIEGDAKQWPVGWPISGSRKKIAPKLFVKISAQVQDAEILKLLGDIEQRIEIPFFYDRSKISANGIDLETTKVSFSKPGKKSSYDMLIDKVLNQCKPKLKSELRIDEVGKVFLWITTRN